MTLSSTAYSGSRFASSGPIYYEYGSMVITFNNSESAVSAYEVLKNCSHENKKLLGEIISTHDDIVERLIMYF